ncbi:MAG: hypothetical protein FP814_09625 [Desulfobacterium sp.]|nr:hypothetical protein [Desulfobacterium sp.]
MSKEKDRFDQKTTWITRVTIDKPFEVQDNTHLCVLTAPDGFSIRSKLFPDNDHKELYEHCQITIGKEPIFRFVNTRNTEISGIPIKLLRKGTCLEFKSDSATTGHKNYSILEKELLLSGIKITAEITERCEKEKCKVKT